MRRITGFSGGVMALALAACSSEDAPIKPEPVETEVPEELQQAPAPKPADGEAEDAAAEAQIGTPMEDRVAKIGLLNKRNNVSTDLEMKPGEAKRSDDVIVRVQACERTAPWEMPQETGAFVQVLVQDRSDNEFKTVHSGWLFKESPSLNVVEHPVYDVWVKDCEMRFPGEDASSATSSSDDDEDS
jgi:hypothetical protein